MSKPSERIEQIYDSYEPGQYEGCKLEHAIIDFLDEEYEKQQKEDNKPAQYDD